MEGWLFKKEDTTLTLQSWKKRWFLLRFDETKCLASFKFWSDENKSDFKGEYFLTQNSLIFSISNVRGRGNCFKLLGVLFLNVEKELIISGETLRERAKWIYEVESIVMQLKKIAEKDNLIKKQSLRGGIMVLPKLEQFVHDTSKSKNTANNPMRLSLMRKTGDYDIISKTLDLKSKSLLKNAETFIKSWVEGDRMSCSNVASHST